MGESTVSTSLRLPAELHERLKREATRQDRTAHNLMLRYIRLGLERDERAPGEGGS